ncbi:MAG: phosphopantetheine-binding protein [Planctomycetia bacterium]|nr:phosphopantetheine-binding protein [Planctomycetia bacterium]
MTTNEFTRGRIKTFDATEARRTRRRNVSLAPKEARENVPATPVAEMPVVEPTPVSTPAVPSSAALAPAPAVATAPTTPAVSRDELQTYLINFVVEQTGYPEDMVELDADLEGDLGIDSIKKAQLLGELNEMFHFSSGEEQAQGTMSLDDFPTLHAILDYMAQKLTANDAAPEPVVTSPATSAAPTAPATSATATPAPATPAVSRDELQTYLINFVVEQTGYPEDMVELDADLEGDLGIDSIKKAQLLGELNEMFHFSSGEEQAQGTMSLDDFPTLHAILDYMVQKLAANDAVPEPVVTSPASPATPATQATPTPATPAVSRDELQAYLINFVVEQTGYPEDMVELDADLEGDLGIDSIKKAQLLGELNEMFHFSSGEEQAQGTMSLDDFPTLHAILDYMVQKLAANDASAPVTTASQPAAAASPTSGTDANRFSAAEIQELLLQFVAEQTGFPYEMIDLDAHLEQELGIDSIKKAQLFGLLSEQFGLCPLVSASLGDFDTLRQILQASLESQS